jgi:hypothetical protein
MCVDIKPAIFYCLEDIGAVDFKHGRLWRKQCHVRYNASPPFRKLMREQTWFFFWSIVFYFGITCAVTCGAPLHFAFGWVLGQFFIWAAMTAAGSWWLANRGLKREREWWDREHGRTPIKHESNALPNDPEKQGTATNRA